MAALWATLGAAIAWGFLGTIPTVVSGQGILIRDGSVVTVESPAAGQVMDLFVNVGDSIREEQLVARVVQQGDASRDGGTTGRTIYVTSSYAGRVLDLLLSRGSVIQAGAALLSSEDGPSYLRVREVSPAFDDRTLAVTERLPLALTLAADLWAQGSQFPLASAGLKGGTVELDCAISLEAVSAGAFHAATAAVTLLR
jgi:pyruvate/2-oxoglutarate dehydrogenase complex dihydrolipoamide acyltransferase (E2) component